MPILAINQTLKSDISFGQPDILIRMTPEEVLLLWVNYYLKKTKVKPINNFSDDIKDCSAYIALLSVLFPTHASIYMLDDPSIMKRAEYIVQIAEKLHFKHFAVVKEIITVSSSNLVFSEPIFFA